MKITVLCVGKIKEKFYRDAILEYSKRLSRFTKYEIIEVADEKTKENASDKEISIVKDLEGEKILNKLNEDSYIITLEINGKTPDSVGLAEKIKEITLNGYSHITFIIGGSLGLSDSVISKSNYHLSFSNMTFPHQLMRVILSEQIYRAFKIINNEPYHK
ncbi:MAG: 23S rRNA (pseudouridine(1915)-N(3))-methyltransferase RlmH [Lachnospiraceae bacterium]|nr:23S rRNA (pseudouridine(1915)-N(3))-methyltransferase RlmH [Lachnospiraceae bacterium]